MLGPGDPVPSSRIWHGDDPRSIVEVIAATPTPLALLCFYPFDWSGG